jgi:long-chain acyl-CoA synthetase
MDGLIVSGDRAWPRAQVLERAARAATGLASTGAGPANAVAVLLRNDIPFLECMLAAGTIGAYCVPINWHFTEEEVRAIIEDSQPTHLVVHADLLPRIRRAIPDHVTTLVVPTPAELRAAYGLADDLAAPPAGALDWAEWLAGFAPWRDKAGELRGNIVYTSGTTGRPKAVRRDPIPPDQREAYARLRADWFGFRPGLRTAMVGPLYHSVQSTYAYAALHLGTVILTPRFHAENLLALIERERLTHLHLVPTMMHRLIQLPRDVRERYDVSSLECVIHGAAPCPSEVKRRTIDWLGPIVHEYYGTSETGMVSRSSSEEWLARPGTVGKPLPGRVVRIYDEDGAALPPNRDGIVYMNFGMVPNFTYQHADDLRARIERDGLVTTGDIGYVDEDGYLFLCDRRQDVIISGGVKIWPAEVEGALAAHPAVHDCAVFGVPDADFGQVPAAVVQPAEGWDVSAEELRTFLQARLARFKVPRVVEIRETVPRDDSGKIYRRLLRDSFAAAAVGAS